MALDDIRAQANQAQLDLIDQIIDIGLRMGVGLEVISATIHTANIESNLGEKLKNNIPGNTASGIFHYLKGTWEGDSPRNGRWNRFKHKSHFAEVLGIDGLTTNQARTDPTAQIAVNLFDMARYLDRFPDVVHRDWRSRVKQYPELAEHLTYAYTRHNTNVDNSLKAVNRDATPANRAFITDSILGRATEVIDNVPLDQKAADPGAINAMELLSQAASEGSMFSYSFDPQTLGNPAPDALIAPEADGIEPGLNGIEDIEETEEFKKGHLDLENQPAADPVQFAKADNLNNPYREIAAAIASSLADVMFYPEARRRAAKKLARMGSGAIGDEPEPQSPDETPASIEAMDWDYIATEVDALARRIEAEITPPPPGTPDPLMPHSIRLSPESLFRETGSTGLVLTQ